MSGRRERKAFIVPLNSMSDVAFLLLIFIMLVSLINYRKEVKIDYAAGDTTKKVSAEKNLEIWIDKNGLLYLDGERVNLEEIEGAVSELYENAPDTRIHFLVDRGTPYHFVNDAITILKRFQYRVVSLVVKEGT